eukprot:scaffold25343_cov68-Cyclotella_meneghiniana.AAC.3
MALLAFKSVRALARELMNSVVLPIKSLMENVTVYMTGFTVWTRNDAVGTIDCSAVSADVACYRYHSAVFPLLDQGDS